MLLCTAGLAASSGSISLRSFEPYSIKADNLLAGESDYPVPVGMGAIRLREDASTDPGRGVPGSKIPASYIHPGLNTDYPGLRVLHLDPLVCIIDAFFSADECDAYKALADHDRSLEHMQSGTFAGTSALRTSKTWFVRYQDCPFFLAKASSLLGKPIRSFEEPQLVRYQPGQQYRWHYDLIHPSLLEPYRDQRLATLLVYLDDVPTGGSTAFRDLRGSSSDAAIGRQLEVQPKRGRALLFFPSKCDGEPDFRMLHAGLPAADGTKRLAQLWLHAGPRYDPEVPRGTCQVEGAELAQRYARSQGLVMPYHIHELVS